MTLHLPGGGVSIARFVFEETPIPVPDGIIDSFTSLSPYISGTLRVFRDGVRVEFIETDPSLGTFQLLEIPAADEDLVIDYIK